MRRFRPGPVTALWLACLVFASRPVEAGITVYTDQAQFESLFSASDTNPLNSLEFDPGPYPATIGVTSAPWSFLVTGSGPGLRRSNVGGFDRGLMGWSGTDTLTLHDFNAGTQGVGGLFGVVSTDGLFYEREGTLTIVANDGQSTLQYAMQAPAGFVGFLSDAGPIQSLQLVRTSGPGTGLVNLSSVTLGTRRLLTPEPTALGASLIGSLVLLIAQRRRSLRASR